MTLSALGLDDTLAFQSRDLCGPGQSLARVTAVDRGRYLVRGDAGEVPSELTGRFLHLAEAAEELPCVGDWVCVQYRDGGTQASIHQVLPRRSFLRRKVAGRHVQFQMIAANVDVAFIVQSCHFDFNVRRLERYLVMVQDGGVEPIVLLTKTDLVPPEAVQALVGRIRDMGIAAPVVCISSVTGEGLATVRGHMAPGRTYCLLGSSGVGKTTLINRLAGDAAFETRAVSHTGEGRHTTTRRHLVVLNNGALLIDMPGMRELGLLGAQEGMDETFSDIAALARACRYPDCSHASEPGCEVQAALARGELDGEHLRHYLKLQKEADFNERSYAERRKKDRAFGRFQHAYAKRKD